MARHSRFVVVGHPQHIIARGNNPIAHFYRDVIPHWRYGNTPN